MRVSGRDSDCPRGCACVFQGVTLAIQAASGIVCSQIPSLAWIAPPVALACTIV